MIVKFGRRVLLAVFAFAVFLTAINNSYAYQIKQQKNILVLHSYHEGLEWTREQNSGIVEEMDKSNDNFNLYVEYMDWKNFPSLNNLSHLYDYYKYKYQDKKIDLIITTDDIALTFAMDYRKDIFSNAPIVFSGVNQELVSRIEGRYENVTGVEEEIDPAGTIKIAMNINPSIKNVYLIFDNSESGISTGKLVTDKIKEMDPKLNIIPLNDLTFNNLLETVGKLKEDDMLLLTTYTRDVAGEIIDTNTVTREVSRNSTVPLYDLYDFGMDRGAAGGDMLSGKLCGSYAAEIALRVLKGENINNIDIATPKATVTAFDYQQLKRFNIPFDRLPKGSEIINKPFSFFETYKYLVLGVTLIFLILVSFLVMLLVYIKKIRKMRKELSASNEELTQTYEELVASDDELKNQLNEISSMQKSLTESEEKYNYLAFHDVLTGLPNRRSLYEDSDRLFSKNNVGRSSLLFIDMDNFKYINDTMGHEFGDLLIKTASERLSEKLYRDCTLYRLGGDEFIILAEGFEQDRSEGMAADILSDFKEEFYVKDIALHISFSLGIAIYPEHGRTVEELIKSADIAMYKAKESGRNTHIVYDTYMNKDFAERMIIEKHLHTAMENNEFELYYQPQLDLTSNRVTGLEALIRWKSPELGFVSPMKFIKIAEDTHLIIQLGEWVLIRACEFLKNLHRNGYSDLTMSVNISTIQIFQSDFNDKVLRILEQFELDPRFLELEITETILIESFEAVYKKLRALREKGIGIALDDFGKGYSSLSYLKQLPISTLKIDKCFIDNVSLYEENRIITRHIIDMGRSMGISVVAEGVEQQEQLDYLIKYECDKMQGYLFSKPLPRDEVEKLLAE